jgi:hypothetical protein
MSLDQQLIVGIIVKPVSGMQQSFASIIGDGRTVVPEKDIL